VAEAKKAGDAELAKQVQALRKPTMAAWAVNHFVRTRPDDLAAFREFAELLREAQRSLDADQLRALGRERARRVDELGTEIASAAKESGQTLGASVLSEVHETLVALIADEEAERTVLTGALVKALSYSGFGSVDIDDAAAWDGLPDDENDDEPAADAPAGEGGAVDLEERRQAKREAERARLVTALEHAREQTRTADRQVAVQTARIEEVTEGIADLERRLATARERLAKVTGELDELSGIRESREEAERDAARALEAHQP
jgi:hypothetical protein